MPWLIIRAKAAKAGSCHGEGWLGWKSRALNSFMLSEGGGCRVAGNMSQAAYATQSHQRSTVARGSMHSKGPGWNGCETSTLRDESAL